MSWNVLITTGAVLRAGQRAQERLRQAGCRVTFSPRPGPFKAASLLPLLEGSDAVLASLDEYSPEVLKSPAAARLKIIARWGVGYDSINLPEATGRGIVVTYTPGLLDEAVADYTFALLLALARRVYQGHGSMEQGEWKVSWGDDVAGKTLGIVGYGRIGAAVGRRAAGFNMRILACRRHPGAAPAGINFVSLDELLERSDFVSLHAALTPQTRGMLGETQLRKMKPTAYLINTARGALVDEAALSRALSERRIAGAALDVFAEEPLPAGSVLRATPNVLLSPHQASFARETGERVSLMAAEAIIDCLQGRRPENVLNPEVFDEKR